MSLTDDQIEAKNFQKFYNAILPYLNGAAHAGFTPIGTVISVMGTTAPMNYLACDGTVYNIAGYTELAAYFNQQFGSSNFFGGDGTTTFAVPDLRGEFLRGTGTNSHANQGSGANVGVHQDGTNHVAFGINQETGDIWVQTSSANHQDGSLYEVGADSYGSLSDLNGRYWRQTGTFAGNGVGTYTSHPTNTSVLYCIASKNIFMDAGSNYSTEEQVVGTWIDGKPIYQKTFTNLSTAIVTNSWTNGICTIPDGDKLINYKAYNVESSGILDLSSALDIVAIYTPTGSVNVLSFDGGQNRQINIFMAQYTKTTDA